MGLRTILLLLCAVGGLSAVLLLTDEKPKTVNLAEPPVLDGRSLGQCTRMRWQFHNLPPIEVTRDAEGRFRLAEPLEDLASAAYMKQIVDAWSSANMRKTPLQDDAEGRKRAGLEPPELTFMAEFPDGARFDVEIGAQGPLGETRFLRRAGKIWEGGDALVESMRVGLEDLREHQVYRHTPPQVFELRVEQASPTGKRETIHLKLEQNKWRLLSPIVGRADRAAAERYLVAVLSQRVDVFPGGLMRPRTDAPNIVVTVRGMQGEETVNLWTNDQNQLYGFMAHRNQYFLTDNRQYSEIFEVSAEVLRARILVSLGENAANVYESLAELVVDPGQERGDRLRLRRESPAAEWRLVEPVEFATHASACTDAAQAVNNLVVQEFVADEGALEPAAKDPRYGLGTGRLQVSLRGFEQKEASELWLGSRTKRKQLTLYYACRADEPDSVVLVPEQAVEVLQRAWTEYCARRVLTITGIGELVVQRGDELRKFRLDGTRWICEGKEGDRAEVGEFADQRLRDLTAKRVLDARGETFAHPAWTVNIARQGGDVLARLAVFEPAPDGPLVVRVTGRDDLPPIAFELGALDSQSLRQLWQ
ncbi:MAG TPA: DUF4340 domain-containing protein [Planctomycetota bacterium]|nr:DUF4340 domain-containing protein [Planctomycetota bacterium]